MENTNSPTENWLDSVTDRLYSLVQTPNKMAQDVLNYTEIIQLLGLASEILLKEPTLVEIDAPVKIIGDLHGQYTDMHRLLDVIGKVPDQKLLFLGDYVDRGSQSIEVILFLLAWKVHFPNRIFLLRGNHETPGVNRVYGFYDECARKFGTSLWWEFNTVFARLPLAALVSKQILCMHGGLSPELTSLDKIREIQKPYDPQERGLVIDLLWSDPTNKGDGWFYSPRGISFAFGKAVVSAACQLLGIDMIIRAHQVVQNGYELMVGHKLVTVFSAPNYCGEFANTAGVACIDKNLELTFQQMRVESSCMKLAPPVAKDLSEPDDSSQSVSISLRKPTENAENQ